jgi:hypothetical protein
MGSTIVLLYPLDTPERLGCSCHLSNTCEQFDRIGQPLVRHPNSVCGARSSKSCGLPTSKPLEIGVAPFRRRQQARIRPA